MHVDYFFKKLNVSSFMSSNNLIYFFLYETSCMLVFSSLNMYIYFSPWNYFCSRNLLRADSCSWNLICLHIFLPECCFMLIFSFWNMMHADFCSWNLLYMDCFFKKLNVSLFMFSRNVLYSFFYSWNLLQVHFLSSWNFKLSFFLLKPVLFMEQAVCWFCSWKSVYPDINLTETCRMLIYSFSKHNLSRYYSSWNLCIFIFLRETWCMLILMHVETSYIWIISSPNLTYLDLCLR